MNCLSHGWGPAVLAPLPGLTWPWSCSSSRRCGCLRHFQKRKMKINRELPRTKLSPWVKQMLFSLKKNCHGPKCRFTKTISFFEQGCHRAPVTSSYDHITVRAPHPIRTAKLSTVEPDQYFGRGLQGNLGCCMAVFCFAQKMCVVVLQKTAIQHP